MHAPDRATTLLLNIDFRATGNSASHLLNGLGNQESTHRWTFGKESRLSLRVPTGHQNHVLVIDATPCLNPPMLTAQTVMLALDGRLLATVQFHGRQVAAFRLPAGLNAENILSLIHLHHEAARAPGQIRNGEALGLMIHSVRVFDLASQPAVVPRPSTMDDATLAARFESIGQGCHFGLIQRQCGAEPLGLLRFVDTMTALLYEGLAVGFAGIEKPGQLTLHTTNQPRPTYRWHHDTFGLMFDTRVFVDTTDPHTLAALQTSRLGFLRLKFLEDCRNADKIFVLTRGDCLTEPEALAVFCALTLHGPCTMLWTTFGDPSRTGDVTTVAPGFLCGQLGSIDHERYASLDAWRGVMRNVG